MDARDDIKKVEVDEEVFAAVQAEARPLEDTFNSALRRRLGLGAGGVVPTTGPDSDSRPRRRPSPGTILAEREYELPLLRALVQAGGSSSSAEVTDAVGAALMARFRPADLEPHESGDIRWRNRTAFVRLRLKELGFLRSDSPRGTWEITDRGREHLSRLESTAPRGRRPPRIALGRSRDGQSAAEVTAEPIAHDPS